ncbi:MAG: GMP synthase [Actinomycetia bacterium]|nr:GMP synthase [Actinomycetes bacterium]
MKRLGILQCDNLGPELSAIGGDFDVLFTDLLVRSDVEVFFYAAHEGELPSDRRECDGWLVSGSRRSVYDDIEWIVALRRFVSETIDRGDPLVGICFGHQMIAMELGAEVAKAADGWNVGAIEYLLHEAAPGEHDTDPTTFTLLASHQDQVLELPQDTRLLASAPTCPIAGFVSDSLLTVQGHPEFIPDLAAAIFRTRTDIIGSHKVDEAVVSLSRSHDGGRVSDWIVDFVKR